MQTKKSPNDNVNDSNAERNTLLELDLTCGIILSPNFSMKYIYEFKVKTTEGKKLLWFYSVKICTLVLKTSLHCFGWYVWIDRFYLIERSCSAAVRKSHSKEILVVKFITAKGILASCWIQAPCK